MMEKINTDYKRITNDEKFRLNFSRCVNHDVANTVSLCKAAVSGTTCAYIQGMRLINC